MHIRRSATMVVIGAAGLSSAIWAADKHATTSFDTEKSVMTVKVFKSGFFSAFGHEHEVSAPIREGTFRADEPAVELAVDARQLRVMDKEVSDKDRAEIQETMLGPKVLDSRQFPEIRFRSTRVDRLGDGKWIVLGDLTLHGQSRPIKVAVEGENGHYHGSAEVRQRDFGITPVTVAGGAVKVKDEVRVEFQIVGKPWQAAEK